MLKDSLIFGLIARVLFFIANIFALYLLLRGHNYPGGGFIAGVLTAVSFILLSFTTGLERARALLRLDPVLIGVLGLTLAVLSSMVPLLFGDPFLRQYNFKPTVPVFGEVYFGTPLTFDIGVYLVVIAVLVKMIFILTESTHREPNIVQRPNSPYASPLEEPIENEPGHRNRPLGRFGGESPEN
ncbi:MAG: MnhB domain-containing protein [Verrucomicrobiota bacterium]